MFVIKPLLTVLLLIGTMASAESPREYPKIFFYPGHTPFDQICSEVTNYQIVEKWKDELNRRFPEFVDAWKREADDLLGTAVKLVGKKFKRQELSATLSLCKFPSMSQPLVINARHFLKEFKKNPEPMFIFSSIVFHEVLHEFISDHLKKESVLLKKHMAEAPLVLSHLHLLALQKAVYLELGRSDYLQKIIEKDSSLVNPAYKRAWKIIEGPEVYKQFIEELRK